MTKITSPATESILCQRWVGSALLRLSSEAMVSAFRK
jgi:hypothetical protein